MNKRLQEWLGLLTYPDAAKKWIGFLQNLSPDKVDPSLSHVMHVTILKVFQANTMWKGWALSLCQGSFVNSQNTQQAFLLHVFFLTELNWTLGYKIEGKESNEMTMDYN